MLNRVRQIIFPLSAALMYAAITTHADTYTYDPLNRLTQVAYDNGTSIGYTYDAAGNITKIAKVGNSSQYTVTASASSGGTISCTSPVVGGATSDCLTFSATQ